MRRQLERAQKNPDADDHRRAEKENKRIKEEPQRPQKNNKTNDLVNKQHPRGAVRFPDFIKTLVRDRRYLCLVLILFRFGRNGRSVKACHSKLILYRSDFHWHGGEVSSSLRVLHSCSRLVSAQEVDFGRDWCSTLGWAHGECSPIPCQWKRKGWIREGVYAFIAGSGEG